MKRISEIRNGLRVCLFIWTVFHLLSGCTQTEVVDEPHLPKGGKEVQAVFNLNVLANRDSQTRSIAFTANGTIDTDSIPLIRKDTTITKATSPLPEAEESRIAQLWIGQYDADGNWIFNQYFPIVTGTKVDVRLIDSGGTSHHVWFVANASDLGKIDTEADLKKRVLTYSSNETGLPENQLCGMTGMWSGIVDEGGVESINVDLTRLVAKISFAYLIGGTDFSFTPTSVTLNSVPDKCQIEAPANQLTADVIYKTYIGTAGSGGATMYWYLPENMAGTVSGENAVDAEKKKTGQGVTNATYIELTGRAIQSGVTYENVTFRFYPGNGMNNYDIVRNSHYTMNVTLVGIDISDERITVGTIPPVDIGGLSVMPAGIGGTTELQITARPGQQWEIKLPDWLSALINGETEATLGSGITYQGPAKLLFKAGTANPRAERRSFTFPLNITGEEQTVEIIQEGATLESGSGISLGAASGSESSSTFIATKGLPWRAVLSGGSWLSWAESNPATSSDAATGESQSLVVKATTSNPYVRERTLAITVEAGASVGSIDYHNLQKEISVSQTGATVQGSEVEVNSEAANNQSSSFIATSGLAWVANVTSGDWISLSGLTSGNPTTGSAQTVSFNVAVNPTTSPRSGEITVRAGDEADGPTGTIAITQKASSLTASCSPSILAATKDNSGTFTFKATSGLAFSITKPDWLVWDGLTSGTTNGSDQNFIYTTSDINFNSMEKAGIISVTVEDMNEEVPVVQSGSTFIVSGTVINLESAATSGSITINGTKGLPWTVSPSETTNGITPDITSAITDGSNQTLTFNASKNKGNVRSATFTIAVTGGDHTKTVEVIQDAGLTPLSVIIDQDVLNSYRTNTSNMGAYPPFNCDGEDRLPDGCTYDGAATMTGSYAIQVQRGERGAVCNYATMQSYCSELNEDGLSDWRIPTQIELYALYINWSDLLNAGASAFMGGGYCSSSVYNNNINNRCRLNVSGGNFGGGSIAESRGIRCVRDVTD